MLSATVADLGLDSFPICPGRSVSGPVLVSCGGQSATHSFLTREARRPIMLSYDGIKHVFHVRYRPPAYVAVRGDCYSVGYSVPAPAHPGTMRQVCPDIRCPAHRKRTICLGSPCTLSATTAGSLFATSCHRSLSDLATVIDGGHPTPMGVGTSLGCAYPCGVVSVKVDVHRDREGFRPYGDQHAEADGHGPALKSFPDCPPCFSHDSFRYLSCFNFGFSFRFTSPSCWLSIKAEFFPQNDKKSRPEGGDFSKILGLHKRTIGRERA